MNHTIFVFYICFTQFFKVMFRKIQLVLGFAIIVLSPTIFAQKTLKKAELQTEAGEYNKAIASYQSYLTNYPDDYAAISKMAELLVLKGDLVMADAMYSKIPNDIVNDPEAYKKHGDLLKKMMRFDDAIAKYQVYSKFEPNEARHLVESVQFAMSALAVSPTHEILVMPVNSNASDFGLTLYHNMPVFTSFREDILMTEVEKEFNKDNTSQKSLIFDKSKNRLVFIKGTDGEISNVGPISFASSGKKCAIIQGKIRDNINLVRSYNNSALYLADVNTQGEITSSKPYIFNEVGSIINAAHLAFDGSVLYFSSNRKGGFGGYDIYVSYLYDGAWSIPQNLGANINTSGDEITPFLDGNKLYFASDWHFGLGGFDIFSSEVVDGVWSNPYNLGNGINSPQDEYFPALNADHELFITSNRLGGRGNNDIYKMFPLIEKTEVAEELAVVPAAVSLDELAAETQKHTVNENSASSATSVSLKEEKEEGKLAFTLPEFDTKKVGSNAKESADFSLEGAHRIALDAMIPNTEVFFIQLASMSSVKPNFSKFKPLLRYGNIYKMMNNKTIKVRLGYFTDKTEAESILAKVRANGYKDAFIAYEILNTAVMELILTGTDEQSFTDKGNFNTKNPDVIKEYKSANKYKVRLASYEDPIWFDVNKVKDLGRIEQWTKGGWTIFILAGYNDLEEAKKAQIQANNRGFKTSEVVIDNGGILERLKKN